MYRFVSLFFVGIMYRFVSVFFAGIHVQVCFCVLGRQVSMYRFVSVYPCPGLFLCFL